MSHSNTIRAASDESRKRVEETARRIVERFASADLPDALAPLFFKLPGRHCDGYSWSNQLAVALWGYSDARGYRDWQSVGRQVRKGERGFAVLAPCTKRITERDASGAESARVVVVGFRGQVVFGLEQTDCFDESLWEAHRPDPTAVRARLDALPMRAVADAWGIRIQAYSGRPQGALGKFRFASDGRQAIALGVENWATWAHELIHAAEHRLGRLVTGGNADQRRREEIVAELGGCVLLTLAGFEREADLGGAWQYIRSWSKADPAREAVRLIDRTCEAVRLILDTARQLAESASAASIETASTESAVAA